MAVEKNNEGCRLSDDLNTSSFIDADDFPSKALTIQTRILHFFLVSILKGTLLEAEIHIYFPHFVYHKKITFWLYLWDPLILDQCIYYFCISVLQMKLLIIFNTWNCTQLIRFKIHDNSLASFELLKAEIWYISAWKEYIYTQVNVKVLFSLYCTIHVLLSPF